MQTVENHNSEFARFREARVPQIILFCVVAWTGFGLYYLFNERFLAGGQCLLQGAIGVLLARQATKHVGRRLLIARVYVGLVLAGLVLDSCVNGLQYSLAPIFFPCAVLVASLTFGKRHAWKILGAVVVSVLAIHYVLPVLLPPQAPPPQLDRVLALLTLLGVIASCTYYAESKTEVFAEQLQETTDQLRERSRELDTIVGLDSLTLLGNRRRFREVCDEYLRKHRRFGLLLIDVDEFKLINDRFGHATGDEVLCNVGDCLRNAVDESDLVYRLGGDEFVVILPEVLDSNSDFEEAVFRNAEKLLKVMDSQFIASGEIRKLGLSIGISFFPKHARSVDCLLYTSDAADE